MGHLTEYDQPYGSGKIYFFLNGCDTTATSITGSNGCCGGVLGGSISGYPSIYVNTAPLKTGDTLPKGKDNHYQTTMELSIVNNSKYCQSGIGAIVGCLRNGYEVTLGINNVTVKGYGSDKSFSNTLITSSNNEIYAKMTSKVSFIKNTNLTYNQNMLSRYGIDLYQGFLVYLNRYDDNGT